jgi:hypothetical protein
MVTLENALHCAAAGCWLTGRWQQGKQSCAAGHWESIQVDHQGTASERIVENKVPFGLDCMDVQASMSLVHLQPTRLWGSVLRCPRIRHVGWYKMEAQAQVVSHSGTGCALG